jgi:hypothetical protein
MKNSSTILLSVALALVIAHSAKAQIATKVHYVTHKSAFIQLGPHPIMDLTFSKGVKKLMVSPLSCLIRF